MAPQTRKSINISLFCAVLRDSGFFSLYSSLDPVHSEHSFLHLEGAQQISIDRGKVPGKQTLDCLESDNLDPRVNEIIQLLR